MTENIWEYIRGEDVAESMRLIGCEDKYISGNASDFEKFREWIAVLAFFDGTEMAKKHCEKIGFAIGENLTPGQIKRSSASLIWKKYASLNCLIIEDLEEFSREEKDNYVPSYRRENITVDFFNNTANILSFSSMLSEDAKKNEDDEISLKNPIEVLFFEGEFNRPDRYTAEKVLKKIGAGEKCNNNENNLLLCQLVCEIIYAKKDNCPIFVFDIKNGSECAEGLINYLVKRDLEARIYLLPDSSVPSRRVIDLCLCGSRKCFVTPVVPKNYSDYLAELEKIYPCRLILRK